MNYDLRKRKIHTRTHSTQTLTCHGMCNVELIPKWKERERAKSGKRKSYKIETKRIYWRWVAFTFVSSSIHLALVIAIIQMCSENANEDVIFVILPSLDQQKNRLCGNGEENCSNFLVQLEPLLFQFAMHHKFIGILLLQSSLVRKFQKMAHNTQLRI